MYYGISLKISGFGVNIYLTQLIYGAIEVPAKIATFFSVDWIGRRNSQAIFLIVTGALIGLNTAIPLGDSTLFLSVSHYLKFFFQLNPWFFCSRTLCCPNVCGCGNKGILRGVIHHSVPLHNRTLPNRPQVQPKFHIEDGIGFVQDGYSFLAKFDAYLSIIDN